MKRKSHDGFIACVPRSLPQRLHVAAAQTARRVNPVNAPPPVLAGQADATVLGPQQVAVLTSKYWGPAPRKLTVSFMERTPADLARRILSHMNAWHLRCGIEFVLTTGTGAVRISRGGGGYWSYLGTDILHIPRNRPTMSLEGFTMQTPESEYKRVVRHETGHSLGCPHEHARRAIVALLDPGKTISYFASEYGWDAQTVTEQVLTPVEERSLMGTPPDTDSIMCYQFPGDCTRSGEPIPGGLDINESDYAFASRIYPKAGLVAMDADVQEEAEGHGDDWPEDEDVREVDLLA